MRIAALLHLAEHVRDGHERPIDQHAIATAHALIEYYTAHTLAAFDTMTTDETTDRVRIVLDWTARTATLRFTARDTYSGNAYGDDPPNLPNPPPVRRACRRERLRRYISGAAAESPGLTWLTISSFDIACCAGLRVLRSVENSST